ncbi:MAG: hypothetical protein ACXAD7_02050 [Candidatus Kariarchaeaceae archaeon]|jgi:hypothetical protein
MPTQAFQPSINSYKTHMNMTDQHPLHCQEVSTHINYTLNISNLNNNKLRRIKSSLYKLCQYATKHDIRIEFSNLIRSEKECCIWFSGHKHSKLKEFKQIAKAVQSNTQKNDSAIFNLQLIY